MNKSGSKKPILGEGEHTYEVTHDWGELPAGIQYGNTHGVCEDSQGRIYIHHTVFATSENSDSMVIFDEKGKFVRSWGKEFKGGAHGLHIHLEGKEEFLYLCDTKRGLVVKTTLTGEEVFTLGYPKESEVYAKPGPEGKPLKYSPTNLAIAPNGDFYVGDGYGSSYINQYNSKGEFIRTFGGPGKEAGQVSCPHGIIVDTRGPDPILTVADRSNKRIQRFTLDGKHVDFLYGTNAPCHFNIYKNGDVVVPDLFARVTLMDKDNKIIANLGDDSQSKYMETRKLTRDHFQPGKFVCPHGACFDHAGNIYVVEWVEVGRVTRLQRVA
jgi:sugar lactone lactonase YvrE